MAGIANQSTSFYKTAQDQAGQVFGNDSKVFNDLMSSYAPVVAAGPGQAGFSGPELAARNAAAIETTGRAYKNAAAATNQSAAAVGGGNLAVTGGAEIGKQMGTANAYAGQTAGELNQIQQENYSTGRQNYLNAMQGMQNAPNTFNNATAFTNAATGAGQAAFQQQNSVLAQTKPGLAGQLLGAAGGIAGSFLGPMGASMGSKLGGMIGGAVDNSGGGGDYGGGAPGYNSFGNLGNETNSVFPTKSQESQGTGFPNLNVVGQ